MKQEKALSKTFTEIAEERANRIYKISHNSSLKDREMMELKMRIMELEEEK